MADGKDIPINIKTTSDNSGTEKAVSGLDALNQSQVKINDTTKKNTEEIEENKRAFAEWQASLNAGRKERGGTSALAVDPKEIDEVTQKIDGAKQALISAKTSGIDPFTRSQAAATGGSRSMNFAMQNMGYQVADVAVQLEMGTSAIRVFTQQGSQMLGAFGAWGAAAGAAVAIVGIGASAIAGRIKEAEVAATKATESRKKVMEEAQEATREAAREAKIRADELKSKDIEDAIRGQNEALAEGLGLIEKQTAAARRMRMEQEEILTAEDDLTLANIDVKEASGEMTSEDAAEQRAEVAVGAKKRADDRRKDEALDAVAEADLQAHLSANTAVGIEMEAAKAVALAEQAKAAEARAKERVKIEEKEKAMNDAKWLSINAHANGFSTDAQLKKIDKAAADAEEDYRKTDYFKLGRDKFKETPESLKKDAAAATEEAARKADEATKAKVAADAARDAAEKSSANAVTIQQASAGTITTVDQKSEIEAKAREARENARRLTVDKKEREEAEKKADDAAKKKASDQERRTADEAGIGRSAMSLLPKGVVEEFRQSVQKVAKGLQDGDQGGEIDELMKLMGQLAVAVEKRGMKSEVGLANLSERIKKLENK